MPDRGAALNRHLLTPLAADVIASFFYQPWTDTCSSVQACGIGNSLTAIRHRVEHLELWRMESIQELVQQLEHLPHWPAILAAHQRGGHIHCKRDNTANVSISPYSCVGLFKSNSIFSPVLGTTWNLQELIGLHRCFRALQLVEANRRSGVRYSRVVHTRVEYDWLHPHPPLAMLDSAHAWIPVGEDYGGGLNDRHAVLSRRAAEPYFERWSHILNGQVMAIDPQLRAGAIRNAYAAQGDSYVRNTLAFYNHSVRRFPGGGALRCCAGRCFSSACYRRALPTRRGVRSLVGRHEVLGAVDLEAAADAIARAAFAGAGGEGEGAVASTHYGVVRRGLADLVEGKYRDELEAAIQHKIALDLPGSRFDLRRAARARPEHRSSMPPLEVCVAVRVEHAPAFRNATLALRIAERIAMGKDGLVGVGRRRKVVLDAPALQFV